MTLDEIKAFVAAVDPNAGHYESAFQGSSSYTVWREHNTLGFMADDQHQGAIRFQIDRFTKDEDDEITQAFVAALEAAPDIAYRKETDYEPDTGYIHHIYDCEGL